MQYFGATIHLQYNIECMVDEPGVKEVAIVKIDPKGHENVPSVKHLDFVILY